MLDVLLQALGNLFDPLHLLCMVLGIIYGIIMGAIPGLTATMAVALLIPVTYGIGKTAAIITLIAVYIGGISGGLLSAILLRMPGTPASIATTLDGYPMAAKGQAGLAIGTGIQASFVGGIFSAVVLALLAPPLAEISVSLGPFEYFCLAIFALSMVAALSEKDLLKGLLSACLGLFLATIGTSPIDGTRRYTFGMNELDSGFTILSVLIGLFAVSELLNNSASVAKVEKVTDNLQGRFFPSIRESLGYWRTYLRSACIGTVMGILPGIGGGPAGLISYGQAKRASSTPEKFGTGHPEGIIASETSNNAVTGGALIPMLTLGIPGDATTAIIMGGLIIHDVRPGPLLFQNAPEIIYTILLSVILLNIIMLIVESFAIRIFIKVLEIQRYLLLPIIILLCTVGTIGINNRLFDAMSMVLFGYLGFILERNKYPLAPLVLGFILCSMVEENARRTIMYYDNGWQLFIDRPIGTVLLIVALIPLVLKVFRTFRKAPTKG